jgi:hypothetical protein
MAHKPFSDYPKEVQDYLQSCEDLLAAAALPANFPLSKEQRAVIARYAVEVLTALTRKNFPS